ncbi:hypothetical protein AALA54_02710 [Oscillospiraceae bacterium 44-34]
MDLGNGRPGEGAFRRLKDARSMRTYSSSAVNCRFKGRQLRR